MKKINLLILLLPIFPACEKADLNTAGASANRAVVEAYLQPGSLPVVQIKKQILYGLENDVQTPIEGLTVSVQDETSGEIYTLTKSDSSAYIGDGTWQPVEGRTYKLSFDYENKTITAETVIPGKPADFTASTNSVVGFDPGSFTPGSGTPPTFPEPIELTWTAESGGYYLIVVESAETDPELIFSDTTNFRPFRAFRSEPQQTNTWNIQSLSFRYYGAHHVILYRLNAEYAALYEDSGSNSTNLTSPFTNVSNGLGIFTGVNADTIVVTVVK